MSSSSPYALQLTFISADPDEPDPAAVGATARAAFHGLRAAGEDVAPVYTGEKGAAEVFLWVLAGSTVVQGLMALPEFALKVAQLLNEIKKLRGDEPSPSTPLVAPPTIVVIRVGEQQTILRSDTAPTDAALLAALLAAQLLAEIRPADVTVEVQVPPTPPNEI